VDTIFLDFAKAFDKVPHRSGVVLSVSNVSVSASYVSFTQNFKVQTENYNYKILYNLQRYLGCLSISAENKHFCLFLNYELLNTIALKKMNVMDVTKAWFAVISASGTTKNVSKCKHDYYRLSMLYLY